MPRLCYVRGADLDNLPTLRDSMFKDRAAQFVERLKWSALTVDDRGWEQDEYDVLNPLYVIWELDDGTHGASMRLLPMNGPNMIHDHFDHVVPRHSYRLPKIWECSRFVVSPRAHSSAVSALFVGAGELHRQNHVEAFIGLFDRRMLRFYKLKKNFPEILGVAEGNDDWIAAGIWRMSMLVWERSLSRLSITPNVSYDWYETNHKVSELAFMSSEKIGTGPGPIDFLNAA